MGKLFGRRKRYDEDEFEDDEMEEDEFEEDELEEDEDYETEDDASEDEEDDEVEEDESEEDASEDDDDNGIEEDVSEDGDDGIDEDEAGSDDDDEDDETDEDASEYDDDEEEDDEEDDEEWDEDDRRAYRHRRRIRNQIIAYSVVFVFLVVVFAGCFLAGKGIVGKVRARQKAKEQAELEAQIQAEQEAQEAHDTVIDAPEPIEEESAEEAEEAYLREIMDGYLSEMPLEDKVASLFIVRPEAITGVSTVTQAGDGTRDALNTYAVGGLVYFEKNILDKEQLTTMLSNTTSMSRYPIFLAIDEEGGSAARVANSRIEVPQVGDMAEIGAAGDPSQAYETGMTIGAYLRELGFNLDFAPVSDMAEAGSELGDRVFGSDAQAVGDMVANVVEGIEGTGVSSCLKHFPGIGDVDGDTHDGRVETDKTLEEMRAGAFLPFQAGIEAGADFVMVGHVTAAGVDDESVPSSLSGKIITDILRNELGFQGVVITDALDMNAITQYYTSEQAAVMAIEAGADMLLMPEDFEAAYEALLLAVEEGTISEERINESLERIYRVKSYWKMQQMQSGQGEENGQSEQEDQEEQETQEEQDGQEGQEGQEGQDVPTED